MLCKGYQSMYAFAKLKTTGCFGDTIKTGIMTMDLVNNEQKQLAKEIRGFASNQRPNRCQHE